MHYKLFDDAPLAANVAPFNHQSTATICGKRISGGAELRKPVPRDGSEDFLACPSRIGNRLFYRDGRVEVVS